MKLRALKLLLVLLLTLQAIPAAAAELSPFQNALIQKIPARSPTALSGSEFASRESTISGPEREQAILDQLAGGNLPDFLRRLKQVQLGRWCANGRRITASIFVMPDYLSIGSDRDFLLIPMALETAKKIAAQFGFILPTKKMVDAIFRRSAYHFPPEPMSPGPQMRSTAYYARHDETIKEQRQVLSYPPGTLVSGHKKDVVLTNRLAQRIGRIAIYGWHRLSGIPIQPLSTVHQASYADYSHGIRLVSETVLIAGQPRSIYDVLEDPKLAGVLSDEGAIPKARQLMSSTLP